MALDPRIILAGQAPNVFDSFTQGQAAGRQNALADLYKNQGGAIMAGDPNALNALAQFDPQAATGVQQQQFGFEQAKLEAMRAAEAHAAKMSAAEAAQAAVEIERAVAGGMAAQTPEQWDAFVAPIAPDLVGQFGNRDMIAQSYMGVAEVMKQRAAGGDRFKVVGNQVVDLTAEGGPRSVFDAGTPESGTVVYDPATGNPIVSTGTAKPVKFTEGQSKDVVFATRAEGALAKLEPVASALTSPVDRAVEGDPTGVVRGMVQSDEFQLGKQAGQEFLQAILRKDTGAAITPDEERQYGEVYLPRPGDSPAVQAQKAESRARAVAALRAGMNIDQITAVERAKLSGVTGTAGPASSPPAGGTGQQAPVYQLTPEDDALLRKYGGGN